MRRTEYRDADGNAVLIVHLWAGPDQCNVCGAEGFHSHAVPWYCGPVAMGASDGGYKSVCRSCYERWAAWDASIRYTGA